MTGAGLLSVFCARESLEQDESNAAQHKNREIGPEYI